MNPRVERRYRALLRAYPPQYRAEHGEEIMDTLAQATPAERSWPVWREARALLVGGLRLRALTAGDNSSRGLVLDGLHIGATLLVAANAAGAVLAVTGGSSRGISELAGLAWVLAFAGMVRGGRLLPVCLVAVAAALSIGAQREALFFVPVQWYAWEWTLANHVLPLVLVAALARRGAPARSPLLILLPAAPYAFWLGVISTPFFLSSTLFGLMLVAAIGALCLAPVDPRPALGLAMLLVPAVSLLTVSAAQGYVFLTSPSWIWAAVWGLAAVTLAWAGTRASHRIVRV
jgi:hypothetical protein